MYTDAYISVRSFINKLNRDRIYTFSATSAFFLILSIFPFLILLLGLVQYTPLTEEFLLERIEDMVPELIFPVIESIVSEIYGNTGGTVVFVSALGTIWSASKGIMSIIRGINLCFNIDDKRNYFTVRLMSCAYTVIFAIALAFMLVMLVFGASLYNAVIKQIGPLYTVIAFFLKHRFIISIAVITLLLAVMYVFLPAKRNKFLDMLPGAFIAAVAISCFSALLSLYVKFFPNFSLVYGSLTSFILLMLWIYFIMYIVFLGGEVSHFFKIFMEMLKVKRQRNKALKYEAKMETKQLKINEKTMRHALKKQQKKNGGDGHAGDTQVFSDGSSDTVFRKPASGRETYESTPDATQVISRKTINSGLSKIEAEKQAESGSPVNRGDDEREHVKELFGDMDSVSDEEIDETKFIRKL